MEIESLRYVIYLIQITTESRPYQGCACTNKDLRFVDRLIDHTCSSLINNTQESN